MTDGAPDLTEVSDPDLEKLLRTISLGRIQFPIRTTDLVAEGLAHLKESLACLAGLDRDAVAALLGAVLAERRRRVSTSVDLVWTGPEVPGSVSRDTAVALRELFASATERVLVAGFWFFNAADILRPLHAVMRDRGVEALMFLHIEPAQTAHANLDAHVAEQVRRFLHYSWPFGEPFPALYYNPDTVRQGAGVILHAKCVVVDERRSLVTSANFTESAQTRNIEVGALIDDATFARSLVQQWRSAADAGFFLPAPQR